jgi:phage terminase large subunit GpA-like protein
MREMERAAFGLVLAAFTAAMQPAQALTASEWAEARRFVSAESGSPEPGKWRNERVPFLVEPMDHAGLDHPCTKLVITGGAQSTKSEVGLNAIGHTIECEPSPVVVLLPSIDETRKYNRVKLDQLIEATPELKARVLEAVSRDERGSTSEFKRFRGGYVQLVNAGSPKGLQMLSARLRLYEEISGYPADTGGRGDPTTQADSRSIAWEARGDKVIMISTPNIKGACRISDEYAASDQRRYYVPCPHCGHYQHLVFAGLQAGSDPASAWYACAANGCVIEHSEKPRMNAAGAWIKTYPSEDGANPAPPAHFPPAELATWRVRGSEGRHPGFHIWRAYSPFSLWWRILKDYEDAKGNPVKLKTFSQQTLGEAWEEQGEAPDAERLVERRQKWQPGRLPAGVLFLTGAVDVQGDRLEWAVYGWDRHLAGYHIARGVIEGDPTGTAPWAALDDLVQRRFQDAWGKTWPVDVWGVDSGYLSQTVYRWAHRHAHTGRVRAIDGRSGWKLPAIGTPKTIDVDWEGRKLGAVQLWPVGTWDLKSELYGKLRMTIQGPDDAGQWPRECMWFGQDCDRPFFEQLTAEFLTDVERRSGYVEKAWVKIKGRRNEQHDLAVYALALARHASEPLTDAQWAVLEHERLGPPAEAQLDLAAIWAPGLAAAEAPATVAAAEPPTAAAASAPTTVNPITGRARGSWL